MSFDPITRTRTQHVVDAHCPFCRRHIPEASFMRLMFLAVVPALFLLAGCPEKNEVAPAPVPTVSAPKAPEGTVYTKKTPSVGAKADYSTTTHTVLAMTVDPGNGKPTSTDLDDVDNDIATLEVQEVSADGITKVKVSYSESSDTKKTGGKETKGPRPLTGNSYIVEAKDGKVIARDDKGKFVPSEEGMLLAKRFSWLGKQDPIATSMPARPLKVGDSVPELAKGIADQLRAGGDNVMTEKETATLKTETPAEGIFAVTINVSKSEKDLATTMMLSGELHLRRSDAMMTELHLSGPITVASVDPKAKNKIDGKGTIDIKMLRSFR